MHETRSERMYRLLLRAYPAAHRRRFAEGMRAAFLADLGEARQRGYRAVCALWARTVRDAVFLGIAERLHRPVPSGSPAARGAPEGRRREIVASVTRDVRHAARRLWRTPGFSLAAIVTLALGIGATSSIYSVVRSVVLRPLPFPHADRLVKLDHRAPGIGVDDGLEMTQGLVVHYGTRSTTLEDVGAYQLAEVTLVGDGDAERLRAAVVTPSLFTTLTTTPHLGRLFTMADRVDEGINVALLSHGLWTRRFGADATVVGSSIRLDGASVDVIGVLPPGFQYPGRRTDVWLPRVLDPATTSFGGFSLSGIARLRPGVTIAEARADLDGLIARLPDAFPESGFARSVRDDAKIGSLAKPLKTSVIGDVQRTLWIVLGTVAGVLLIACVNVANLFLVRAEGRHREVAVRTALGAGRGQLVGYFLSESLLLGVLGGTMGLLLTVVGVQALVALGPPDLPRLHEVTVDANVVLLTAATALAAGVAFGLAPILRAGRDMTATLKDGGRSATGGRGRFHTRTALAVSQVALALALLVGSGLMVRSFQQLTRVDPGFASEGVLTFQLGLPRTSYPTRAAAAAFHADLLARFRGLPGVEEAGVVVCRPLLRFCGGDPLYDPSNPPDPGVVPPIVQHTRASEGYFETLRIPLLSGRTFERADYEQRKNVVIVSRSLVERYWPDSDPVGRLIGPGAESDPDSLYTVVGVVEDVYTENLTANRHALIYLPLVSPTGNHPQPYTLWFMLRTARRPLDLVPAVRREVRTADPTIAMAHTQTMRDVETEARRQAAFTMSLLLIAAVVGLALGTIGVYGVIAYVVSARRGEIGVRLALGARAVDVSRMVLKHGGVVAGMGLVAGLTASIVLTRLMRSVLFGVAPFDALTYGVVSVVLVAVVLLATYLPARRAAAVNPVDALKTE